MWRRSSQAVSLPRELWDAILRLALPLLCALQMESCPCLSKASSWNLVGPTAPPEENGHFLLCDIVGVHQLLSWPTVSPLECWGGVPPLPHPHPQPHSPPSSALVPHLPSFIFSLCVEFRRIKDLCFPHPCPRLSTTPIVFFLALLSFLVECEKPVAGRS